MVVVKDFDVWICVDLVFYEVVLYVINNELMILLFLVIEIVFGIYFVFLVSIVSNFKYLLLYYQKVYEVICWCQLEVVWQVMQKMVVDLCSNICCYCKVKV